MALKNGTTTYTLTLAELRDMFAKELGVDVKWVSVDAQMKTMGDQRDSWEVLSALTVTVKRNGSESDER